MDKQWWLIFWSPEGRPIAKTLQYTSLAAKKRTPKPYREHMGEVYVMLESEYVESFGPSNSSMLIQVV